MDPKPTSLIFDLDGTLWNSAATVAKAWNQALLDLEIKYPEITVDDIAKLMGLPHTEIVDKFLVELDRPTRELAMKQGYKVEEAVLEKGGGEFYPGVKEGLQTLSKHYPLYLVSNCQVGYLDAFFQWSGTKEFFKDWECHGNTNKPKWENLLSVVERNQLKYPVYIGDTARDQSSARKASVPYIHCNYGFGEPEQDCKRVNDFDELVTLFCK